MVAPTDMAKPSKLSPLSQQVAEAVRVLHAGGVIAYPTEYCYGLGCDPQDQQAVERILTIKGRAAAQGLILVGADVAQVEQYAEFNGLKTRAAILQSWPGPTTWVLPKRDLTPQWISGDHASVAMRVSAYTLVTSICAGFGGAIVSTSANRSGQPALLSADSVAEEMSAEVDYIVAGDLGERDSTQAASKIFNGITGKQLR